ncbi:hypothetical protein ETD83_20990 [Actinomadura soli]|uniref:Uncharacterized protein n=1 Tax=Actinomadura soli TaxID=2508997 RepID=A0A5C4JBH6_9ACTN|nr:hypothetical protein [Actinomadura soli]TMQ96742.1 hypothetical protein ETD83_20990 [Actinomadura soli]
MSDQGERGVRWTDMSESEPGPAGRTEFSDETAQAHDVWGKVETRPREVWADESQPENSQPENAQPESPWAESAWAESAWADEAQAEEGDDVKVAPVREDEPPHWEGSLFDEGDDDGDGDGRYTPAVPTGLGEPAKPGKPSSGNWQMPAWMADEAAADAKLGAAERPRRDVLDDNGGRSRVVLFGGVGLLVAALVAAGAVYLLKGGGEPAESDSGANAGRTATAEQSEAAQVELPPDKRLKAFPGRPSRMLGRVADVHSGLSYPRLAAPWKVPTKRNRLGTPGWSGQQILVTEKNGGQLWYGQLLTGTLLPSLQSAYQGPDSVKNVAGLVAKGFEAQYYGFPHRSAPLASQPLNVDGRQGWLIASYLTYKRDGVRATGEIYATAVIDTGRKAPAVVFVSMPNTHKKMYPDVNAFFTGLKIAS